MLRERIKAVTFDLYGTAVPYPDSSKLPQMLAWTAEQCGLGLNAEGLKLPLDYLNQHLDSKAEREKSFAKLRREGRKRYWDYWYTCLLVMAGVDDFDRLSSYVAGMFRWWHFHPDLVLDPQLPPLLRKLRGLSLKLGILSNAPPEVLSRVSKFGLLSLVDKVILSGSIGLEKPDPEIFEITAKGLGVELGEILHIGDNPFADIEPAWRVGIHPVLYDPKGEYPDTTHIRITSLWEIMGLLGIGG